MFSHTHSELTPSELIERTILLKRGVLSRTGALVVDTGAFSGRSANDKYVVSCTYSEKNVNWANNTGKLTRAQAEGVKKDILSILEKSADTYTLTRQVGADPKFRIKATLITQGPSHALFFDNMMRDLEAGPCLQDWTIFHAPYATLDNHTSFGVSRPQAIVLDFEKCEVMVIGTAYAGEVKKAMFSVLNTILPDHGVLPMHAGASINDQNKVSVFFGLSGTGKTTLSTDEGFHIIGDDEHGLSDQGIFNFEGGCYAKTAKLSQKDEPQIYQAANSFGTLLENVTLKKDRTPDFDDLSKTENGRASYSLTSINGVHPTQRGPVPTDLFFLSADATGVLPPVASLNPTQAMEFFLCGYTSKLAGTEIGVKEPKSAFSYCFGAPFMQRRPQEYAELLANLMKKHNFNVWLINTGWGKGGYPTVNRFPLKITRTIIRAIQNGHVDPKGGKVDPIFGFLVPQDIAGVDSKLLAVSEKSDAAAIKLKGQFDQQLKSIRG